jgi:hypothetical protein
MFDCAGLLYPALLGLVWRLTAGRARFVLPEFDGVSDCEAFERFEGGALTLVSTWPELMSIIPVGDQANTICLFAIGPHASTLTNVCSPSFEPTSRPDSTPSSRRRTTCSR